MYRIKLKIIKTYRFSILFTSIYIQNHMFMWGIKHTPILIITYDCDKKLLCNLQRI